MLTIIVIAIKINSFVAFITVIELMNMINRELI